MNQMALYEKMNVFCTSLRKVDDGKDCFPTIFQGEILLVAFTTCSTIKMRNEAQKII